MPTTVVIIKCPYNPVQFTPVGIARSVQNHTIHQGQAPEYDTLLRGQDKAQFIYQAEFTDQPEFQFSYTYTGVQSVALEILQPLNTPTGQKWVSIYAQSMGTPITSLTTNTAQVNGVPIQLYTVHSRLNLPALTQIPTGMYKLRLAVTYSDQNNGVYDRIAYEESELIDLRRYHPGTVLLRSRSLENKDSTVFVQTGARFQMRIIGALWGQSIDGEYVSFANQSGDRRTQYDRVDEFETLTVGGAKGVSKWAKSAVAHYMTADLKSVDGLRLSKNDGAKWEMIAPSSSTYPLGGMSISVALLDRTDRYKSIFRPYISVYSNTSGNPYFISAPLFTLNLPFGGGTQPQVFYANTYIAGNGKAGENGIYNLNRAALAQGLTGRWYEVNGELRYQTGENEDVASITGGVLTKTLTYTSNGNAGTLTFALKAITAAIIFADGTQRVTQSPNTTPVNDFATANYPASAANRITRVFHADSLVELAANGSNIISDTGDFPIGMTQYSVNNTQIVTFDWARTAPASGTLYAVGLANNKLTSTTNSQKLRDGSVTPAYSNLAVISSANNLLSVTEIGQIILNVDAMVKNVTGTTGGTLNTSAQTPPAPPAGSSSTGALGAKNDLINNYGWTVTTD